MTTDLGKKTFNMIGESITKTLTGRMKDLNDAYWNTEKELTLAVSIKIEPVDDGNKIKITTGFVKERIRDESIRVVNEKQGELFDDSQGGSGDTP